MSRNVLLFSSVIALVSLCAQTQASAGAEEYFITALVKQTEEHQTEDVSPADFLQERIKETTSFYKTVSLFDGKLKIFVPGSFSEMPTEMIAIKYPNTAGRPSLVYTNTRMNVNVAFRQVAIPTEQEDLPEVKDFLSEQLLAAKPMNFQSRIEKINGSDYVIFEFMSQAADTKIYNLMFATDVGGELLIGTFNCTEALKNEWQSRAKEIVSSLKKG